jgi:hypothetical protein
MGSSTFKVLHAGPGYVSALLHIIWDVWRGRRSFVERTSEGQSSISGTDLIVSSVDQQPQKLDSRVKSQKT